MIVKVFGFSLFLFVELICFHKIIIFPNLFEFSQEMGIILISALLLSKALGYFGSSFLSTLYNINLIRVGKIGILLFISGVLILLTISTADSFRNINFVAFLASSLAGALIGIGSAFLNLLWGQQCSSFSLKKSYLFILSCQTGAIVIYMMISLISNIAQLVVVIFSLILILISLFRTTSIQPSQFNISGLRESLGELWRPIFGTSVFCFLAGLMTLIAEQYENSIEIIPEFLLFGFFIMVIILVIFVLTVKKFIRLENAYEFLLPGVATGFFLLSIFLNSFGGIVDTFMETSMYAAGIVLWCLTADSVRRHGLNAVMVFGLSLGITVGASALGALLGYFLGRVFTEGDIAVTTISLVSLYILLVTSLIIFKQKKNNSKEHCPSSENLKSSSSDNLNLPQSDGPDISLPDSKSVPACEPNTFFDERVATCTKVAADHKLSARETEVLIYLGKGLSMVDIAHALSVSENTARTHIKHIHRKLDVHSKQDIIDLCRNSI